MSIVSNEFYCGSCGRYKNISCKVTRGNLRPQCTICNNKAKRNSRRSDAAKERARAKTQKYDGIEHLMPRYGSI